VDYSSLPHVVSPVQYHSVHLRLHCCSLIQLRNGYASDVTTRWKSTYILLNRNNLECLKECRHWVTLLGIQLMMVKDRGGRRRVLLSEPMWRLTIGPWTHHMSLYVLYISVESFVCVSVFANIPHTKHQTQNTQHLFNKWCSHCFSMSRSTYPWSFHFCCCSGMTDLMPADLHRSPARRLDWSPVQVSLFWAERVEQMPGLPDLQVDSRVLHSVVVETVPCWWSALHLLVVLMMMNILDIAETKNCIHTQVVVFRSFNGRKLLRIDHISVAEYLPWTHWRKSWPDLLLQ